MTFLHVVIFLSFNLCLGFKSQKIYFKFKHPYVQPIRIRMATDTPTRFLYSINLLTSLMINYRKFYDHRCAKFDEITVNKSTKIEY